MIRAITNSALQYIVLATLGFIFLYYTVDLDVLITIENGAFFGLMFGIAIAYGQLYYRSLRGDRTLSDDVRQFTVTLMLAWVAYGLAVSASTYSHAADLPTTPLFTTALSRYVAIVGAIMQITISDYLRDRLALFVGFGFGTIAACFVVYIQASQALALSL